MKDLQDLMENTPSPMILSTYVCETCEEIVKVAEMAIAGGPDKGKMERFYMGCKCEDLVLAKRVIENDRKARMNRTKDIFDQNSLVNQSLLKATFENYIPPSAELNTAKQSLVSFVNEFNPKKGKNLLLVGTYGTGKSHLSYATAKSLIANGHSALFLSVPKLLTKIKDTYNPNSKFSENDLLEYVAMVDLLVLDDLGAEYTNVKNSSDNWTTTKLFEVIDSRAGKHTIYTTNLSSVELESKVNARNFSRIMDNTDVVPMNGRDYRKKSF
ncbi:ATP-binding protein [Bacillus sp. FJAT-22090]|uniref:ATP-binding protein n=1 Tax=Bacillus sp. FJAT-22090 TaxID=1581038 RepID=UPI0021B3A99B|nr:ATP-binding protein [Bacillus sp. FJAT-22090]